MRVTIEIEDKEIEETVNKTFAELDSCIVVIAGPSLADGAVPTQMYYNGGAGGNMNALKIAAALHHTAKVFLEDLGCPKVLRDSFHAFEGVETQAGERVQWDLK